MSLNQGSLSGLDGPPSRPTVSQEAAEGVIDEAPCRYGAMQFLAMDDPIGRSLRLYGEWAQHELGLLSRFAPTGATVLDIGANVGTHSIAFDRMVGPAGRVLAFEPQPLLYDLLVRNVGACEATSIAANLSGVAEKPGYMYVPQLDTTSPINSGATSLSASDSETVSTRVEVVSIDDLELTRCDLIKIDVEGMEASVIAGAERTITAHEPVLLVECNNIAGGVSLLRVRDWKDYKVFVVRTSAFNGGNYNSQTQNIFGCAQETGLLFVPSRMLDAIPPSTDDEVLIELDLPSLDTFAEALLMTPRFGDLGPHDRDWRHLLPVLRTREDELGRLSFRSASFESAVSRLSTQLESAQRQLESAQRERDAARAEAELLKNELEAVYASNSWRSTRGIRALTAALRDRQGKPHA